MLEEMARIPVEVEYASEFRYRNPVVDERTLVIGISPVGRDGRHAGRDARGQAARGARTIGLVNVVGCTIAREVDGGIYLHAGPEIGVASTKAFTSQVAALALVTLRLGAAPEPEHPAGPAVHRGARRAARADRADPRRSADEVELAGRALLEGHERALPRPRRELPGGARGRAQAQGDLLHPRRGLSRGGDEARADRADRREHAGGVHRARGTRCTRRSCPTSKR